MKQNPKFDQWCRMAANYVSKAHRSAVYAELYGHLEDHYNSLLEAGNDEDAAEQQALEAMGDAAETGRELRRAEWTPKGLIQLLRDYLAGNAWVSYYRGTDERRYLQLCRQLREMQIEFRTEELDALSRTVSSMSTFGRHPTDSTPRRDGTSPAPYAMSQFNTWSNSSTIYSLALRRRDLAAVQRLERI